MDHEAAIKGLGAPALKLGALQIWVHGRQFPNNQDYWDGNWLRVTAHCGGNGASVFATGPIIHLSEVERWVNQLENLSRSLKGEANLQCIEPNLTVGLKASKLGQIALEISITPDQLIQRHWFEFAIDQTFLDPFIKQIRAFLKEYPLRGSRDAPRRADL